MKLLFVHERFGALGGAESNARSTAFELRQRGHTIGLLHGDTTGSGEEAWAAAFPWRRQLNGAGQPTALAADINAFGPHLIYVHKMADLGAIEILLQTGVPMVRMVHDHDIYCMKSYKYAYLTRRICQRPVGAHCVFPCGAFIARSRTGLLPVKFVSYRAKVREVQLNRQFDRMLVVSNYMKEELLRNGFEDTKIEIHPPVPRVQDPQPGSSFSDRNLIVFAGQIIRGKGVDVLLRALALLKGRFECVILGDGSHRTACERLRNKLGLAGRVVFKGFVPQEELAAYYHECTLVAVSSVWPEPIATIGLEAMGHALPVVAFDAGGIRDWLHDGYNGFLVPWMDISRFAERVRQLLENKALARQMGQNGLTLSRQQFDFGRYISNLEQMFIRTIAERRQRVGAPACAFTRTGTRNSPDENAGISRCPKQPDALL